MLRAQSFVGTMDLVAATLIEHAGVLQVPVCSLVEWVCVSKGVSLAVEYYVPAESGDTRKRWCKVVGHCILLAHRKYLTFLIQVK